MTRDCVALAGPQCKQLMTWVCSYLHNHPVEKHITGTYNQSSNPDVSFSLFVGTDKYGFGFGGTGKKSHNKQFDSYGEVTANK